MNQQTLKGQWNQIKGKITEKWGDLTEDELQSAKGSTEQLIGMIQHKTGETRDAISNYLDSIMDENGMVGSAVETAREYAASAAETAQQSAQQAMDQVKAGYVQTERMVKSHPMESLAVCFGVGVVTGVIGGLLLRSR